MEPDAFLYAGCVWEHPCFVRGCCVRYAVGAAMMSLCRYVGEAAIISLVPLLVPVLIVRLVTRVFA
jgi:hypothetical protein